MASWQVQDAKARFSELLDATIKKGPQIVTRRGMETAVLVPIEEWNRLASRRAAQSQGVAAQSGARFDNLVPERGKLPTPPRAGVRVNRYLLDTNVVSELRRDSSPWSGSRVARYSTENEQLFLSAVTIGELQAGSSVRGIKIPRKRTRSILAGSTSAPLSSPPNGCGLLSRMGPRYGRQIRSDHSRCHDRGHRARPPSDCGDQK